MENNKLLLISQIWVKLNLMTYKKYQSNQIRKSKYKIFPIFSQAPYASPKHAYTNIKLVFIQSIMSAHPDIKPNSKIIFHIQLDSHDF